MHRLAKRSHFRFSKPQPNDAGDEEEDSAERKLQQNEPLSKRERMALAKRRRGDGAGADSSSGRRFDEDDSADGHLCRAAQNAAELVPEHVARCPAFTRIVDWIATLLDSNLARILLLIFSDGAGNDSSAAAANAHASAMGDVVVEGGVDMDEGKVALEILQDLRDIVVSHHAALCKEVQTLKSFLNFWKKQVTRKAPKPIPAIPSYSIQLLSL